MWLQVDDGELVVVSCSAGPVAGNNQFEIGSYAGAGSPHDGRLDDPVLFKATCTPERRAYLYNDGAGRAIPTLTGPALACLGDSKTLGAGDSQFRRGYIQALRSLIDGRIVGVLPASAPAQTGTLLSEFPAWAATVTHPPDKVLLNVGTNDFDGIPGNESVWQGLMQDILDAIWGLWPAALVYIAIPWKRDFDAVSDTVAGIVAALLADNPSLVRYGIDERIVLKHNDNGASRTSDGVHPTDACYVNIYAPAWEEAITA
jgi:lysophospholipase L1-like esterase